MTEPRGMRRRRRTDAGSGVPADVAAWFAGEPRKEGANEVPWNALVYPGYMLLREWWEAWSKDRPGAKPPPGYEEIAEPPPARMHGMPYDEAMKMARDAFSQPRRARWRRIQ